MSLPVITLPFRLGPQRARKCAARMFEVGCVAEIPPNGLSGPLMVSTTRSAVLI